MTMNQELSSDTKHETRTRAELCNHVDQNLHKTLTRPHSNNHIGLALCLGARVILDQVGPGKDTHGTPMPREGRPWVAHNTIHSATNVHN